MSPVTVAVLGTGKMGAAMARRLHEQGFAVRLWNRTRQRAEQVGVGEVCASPADAASGADVVITMLTDPKAIRATYFGEQGALEALGSRIYVDCSTVNPAAHEEIAQAAGKRGAFFLAAPVLGSVPAAGSGKLLVLVGGDQSVLATARPVLAALGEVRHIGALGTASRLKLVANSMLAVISEAAAELFNAGVRSGLDKERIWEVLIRLAPYLDARKAGFVEGRYEPVNFRLADMVKDLDLALDAYREAGAETPLTKATRDLFARAMREHGESDLAAISELWREPATPRG
jgi:3-hydroxyisobutyrate dehydrogenase-like beta-hydroxyacid dehydrogenase